MKKITTLLLITCILMTGCSKSSLKQVQKNLETAKNYNAKVSLKINGKFNGNTVNYIRTKDVIIDNINGTAKVNANIKLNDEEKDELYYIKTTNQIATTYKENLGIYEAKEEAKDQNSLYYVTAFVNENSDTVQKEKIDGKIQYVLLLKKDRVVSFLKSYYDVNLLNETEYKVIEDVMLKITVSKKGIIEKLEADFSQCMKYLNLNYDIKEFKLEIDYSNFNNANEVIIPSEIIDKSYDSNLIKMRQYAYDYVKEVNTLQLGNTTMNNVLGYTITEAELTIVENVVNKGTIKIDNYIIEIINGEVGIPKEIE